MIWSAREKDGMLRMWMLPPSVPSNRLWLSAVRQHVEMDFILLHTASLQINKITHGPSICLSSACNSNVVNNSLGFILLHIASLQINPIIRCP